MKTRLIAFLLALAAGSAGAQVQSVAQRYGINGFGTETTAGEGGRVLRVTSLASEGAGSLRAALEASGPRTIIFEVAGVIDLERRSLRIREPFVTVAGQSAPAPGITLIRGGLSIEAHDVLLQHLRFRMGDAGLAGYRAPDFAGGWDVDVTTAGARAYNIVVDHCSFAWAIDENLSISGERYKGPEGTSRRVTFAHNLIAEGLMHSAHSKRQAHSMGTLVHDEVRDVALYGNLWAHNNQRNPLFKGGTSGVVVNNLIYNPGSQAMGAGAAIEEWAGREMVAPARMAVVGNHLLGGADTRVRALLTANGSRTRGFGAVEAFARDNLIELRAGTVPVLDAGIVALEAAPLWPTGLVAQPASAVREAVLAGAGAWPRARDAVDARIVADVQGGGGRIIDSQNEVGGYPLPQPPVRQHIAVADEDLPAWLAARHRWLVEGR